MGIYDCWAAGHPRPDATDSSASGGHGTHCRHDDVAACENDASYTPTPKVGAGLCRVACSMAWEVDQHAPPRSAKHCAELLNGETMETAAPSWGPNSQMDYKLQLKHELSDSVKNFRIYMAPSPWAQCIPLHSIKRRPTDVILPCGA